MLTNHVDESKINNVNKQSLKNRIFVRLKCGLFLWQCGRMNIDEKFGYG